ncbi:MAG: serine/threonine-protein kinase [Acidobacteriaceae bacterium]|nr:serine/threonine-protein kinase [Acidobacteriaceae bacterium]
MTSGLWERIERVYYSVIASPPGRRAALLDELCVDDPAVKREVESLLEAREQAGNFLSRAGFEAYLEDAPGESYLMGQTLDHYEILSSIGAGAMGEVYLARDTRLERQVALKILPARYTRDTERVARFRREAKAASALNHPNIMTIYEIGEVDGVWFIAAEFIEGVTLRERLATGKLEVRETIEIAVQSASALNAAHQAGIVHRDIKPENIMVRGDGLVKVVDFGLARMENVEKQPAADMSQAGALIGTPRYMSPEQARGQKLDARTDVFSLGAVVYEMATGRPAFPGSTPPDVFANLLNASPVPPSKCVAGIPQGFDRIVFTALNKDCKARYQNMQQFAADLEDLRVGRLRRSRRMWREMLIAAAVLIGILVLAFYVRTLWPGARSETAPLNVVPLTSFGGSKDFGSFSPDGRRIAFSWNGGKGSGVARSIYIKTIGSEEPLRLTFAPADDRLPVWSPDGRYIAFCRALSLDPDESRYGIYLVPVWGGQERKIAEGEMGVSWSPDGKQLALAGPRESGGIYLLSLESGKRREVTSSQPNFDILPVFSADGRTIAFTRDFGFSAREIFVVRPEGETPRQLTFDHEPTYGAAWTPDSRELVFSSNRGVGGESLWRIAAAGGSPRRVSATLSGAFYPAISKSGGLLYTESFKDTNIYAYEAADFGIQSVPARFNGPYVWISSSRRDDSPSISPDGERIAFVSKRTGNEEIWVCDRKGQRPVRLTSFKGSGTGTPRWSPDGRLIAFDSLAAGNPNIDVIDAEGGTPRQLTTGPAPNFMPSWSPDGNWIYFKSNRSGNDQIWRIRVSGGAAVQVTYGGGSEAFASPDGKRVYFTKTAWSALWSVPVDGGPEQPVRELEHFDKIFRSWGIVDRGIYFISKEDLPHQTIRFFSFATRQVTPLVRLDREPIWDYPDLVLSRDGSLLLSACLDQEVNDLMLIENFH